MDNVHKIGSPKTLSTSKIVRSGHYPQQTLLFEIGYNSCGMLGWGWCSVEIVKQKANNNCSSKKRPKWCMHERKWSLRKVCVFKISQLWWAMSEEGIYLAKKNPSYVVYDPFQQRKLWVLGFAGVLSYMILFNKESYGF
jgi:hypothetical protein